jgi:predicted phosphodiesterase
VVWPEFALVGVLLAIHLALFIALLLLDRRYGKSARPNDSQTALEIWSFYAIGFWALVLLILGLTLYSLTLWRSSVVVSLIGLFLAGFLYWRVKPFGLRDLVDLARWWYPTLLHPLLAVSLSGVGGLAESLGQRKEHKSLALVILWFLVLILSVVWALCLCIQLKWLMSSLQQTPSLGGLVQLSALIAFGFGVLAAVVWLTRQSMQVLKGVRIRLETYSLTDSYSADADGYLRLAHLSDLHIPALYKPLTEGKPFSYDLLSNLRQGLKVNATTGVSKVDAVLITGDVTDTGAPQAWDEFYRTFASRTGVDMPLVIFAPGNHDLNVVGYGLGSLLLVGDGFGWKGRLARMQRYLERANAFMGQHATVLFKNEPMKLDCAFKQLDWWDTDLANAERYRQAEAVFPMVVIRTEKVFENVCFIIWNSTRPTTLALNNAFGRVDVNQLARFRELFSKLKLESRICIHLVHHKLSMPSENLQWSEDQKYRHIQMAGMVLERPDQFAYELKRCNGRHIVLHGHHHSRFSGRVNVDNKEVALLFSAASTTLGAESYTGSTPAVRGFDILTLKVGGQGGILLTSSPVVLPMAV